MSFLEFIVVFSIWFLSNNIVMQGELIIFNNFYGAKKTKIKNTRLQFYNQRT